MTFWKDGQTNGISEGYVRAKNAEHNLWNVAGVVTGKNLVNKVSAAGNDRMKGERLLYKSSLVSLALTTRRFPASVIRMSPSNTHVGWVFYGTVDVQPVMVGNFNL